MGWLMGMTSCFTSECLTAPENEVEPMKCVNLITVSYSSRALYRAFSILLPFGGKREGIIEQNHDIFTLSTIYGGTDGIQRSQKSK